MKKALVVLGLASIFLAPVGAYAQQSPTYGPYSVLSIDKAVVEDVIVEGNDIYVKVNKNQWNLEFLVKASSRNKDGYHTWANGSAEMAVKVYQSQAKNKQGYTYRISTSGRFIEYWTGGKLVLHLEKVK